MKREGFTLIELLVVIAVIALIIAISLPVYSNMKRHAEAVVCESNVKELVLSLTMFEYDNGTFPHAFSDTPWEIPLGGEAGSPLYDRPGLWWFNHIIDYSNSRKNTYKNSVILCPSRKINDIRLKNNVLCGNYGVNLSICKNLMGRRSQDEFVGTPLSSSNISHPSRTLLIVDCGYSMISWWHVTDVPPVALGNSLEDAAYVPSLKINEEKTPWPGLEWDAIVGRHPKQKINVGFVDGHVERRQAEELFVEKTETGYKNHYPLWRPNKGNND